MQADKIARLTPRRCWRTIWKALQQAGVLQLPKAGGRGRLSGCRGVECGSWSRRQSLKRPRRQRDVTGAQNGGADDEKNKPQRELGDIAFRGVERTGASQPADLSLEVIQQEVAGCTRCAELASTRTQTVFGVGNPNARLCFLGEARGRTKIDWASRSWAAAGNCSTRSSKHAGSSGKTFTS